MLTPKPPPERTTSEPATEPKGSPHSPTHPRSPAKRTHAHNRKSPQAQAPTKATNATAPQNHPPRHDSITETSWRMVTVYDIHFSKL